MATLLIFWWATRCSSVAAHDGGGRRGGREGKKGKERWAEREGERGKEEKRRQTRVTGNSMGMTDYRTRCGCST